MNRVLELREIYINSSSFDETSDMTGDNIIEWVATEPLRVLEFLTGVSRTCYLGI